MKYLLLLQVALISFSASGQTKQITLTQSTVAGGNNIGKISLMPADTNSSGGFVVKISLPKNDQTQVASIAEVENFANLVVLNNGSLSDKSKQALNRFVNNAKIHEYWDKLITVNTLAGNDLKAALIHLKYQAEEPLAAGIGYSDDDYTILNGLTGNESTHLYTRTNLASDNTEGTGGYHVWVGPGTTGTFGTPNYATPYSIVVLQPGAAVGYYGTATTGADLDTSKDNFIELVKQSLTSLKLIINGEQKSANNSLTGAVNRDEEIRLNLSRNVWFYAIDNGKMSDNELADFYKDVRQLMYDLGRKLAPPVINKNGLYTSEQTVKIGALASSEESTIYYTTDGTAPTISSPVYNSPLTIRSTTRIRSIVAKNDRISEISDAWVAIVPPSFATKKYYTTHLMVNLSRFTDDMDGYIKRLKDAGYNLLWAHLDGYFGTYSEDLLRIMDAAEKNNIPVMPGFIQGGSVASDYVRMIKDTWNHPALFKIDGKRCYSAWDYIPDIELERDSALLAETGIAKSDFYLIANSRFPISYDGGKTFIGENVAKGITYYTGTGLVTNDGQVQHLYDIRPFDGFIGFSLEMDKQSIIRTNKNVTKSSRLRGKFCLPSVNAFYASTQFRCLGFRGLSELWDSILALPVDERPNGVVDVTANDGKELSYIGPLERIPVNGVSHYPHPSEGFSIGGGIREPWLDHSGPQAFVRPWIDAFLNNQPEPLFSQDRMFAWYWLHPKDVPFHTTIPDFYKPYLNQHYNQSWWDETIFARGSSEVWSMLHVPEVANEMDSISMSAHLTAPAQLKINNTLSPLFPAGPAYFKIARENFLGIPLFAIVRNEETVMSGKGLQPIVNDAWPGGWNYLSAEIFSSTPAAAVAASAQQKVSSISTENQSEKIQVYPNPAGQYVNFNAYFENSGNHIIRLFNATGIVIYKENRHFAKGKNSIQISMAGLNKGMYVLKVYTSENVTLTKQIMKK